MLANRRCQICEALADVVNGSQAFCDTCFGQIRDVWSGCLRCGQIFPTYREHNGHMNAHRLTNQPGSQHYSVQNAFVRLPRS